MNGRPVIVDLETYPIDGVEAFVDEDVSAPANYKDPDKIAAYIAEAKQKQAVKAALYPYTCRIVALGAWSTSDDAPRVRVCQTEAEEAETLQRFWASVWREDNGAVTPLVTFNGIGFDLPVLMARSRLLGVAAPQLNTDRYRSPHPDLMQILTFRGAITARSLKWFARRFGLPVEDETGGADIAALVQAGDWDAIKAHCESDVRLTHALAVRMGLITRPLESAVV